MNEYDDYDVKYPNLILEIMDYFTLGNGKSANKSVLGFCELSATKNNHGLEFKYQPNIIDRICQMLCKRNVMSCIRVDGGLGLQNNYMVVIKDKQIWRQQASRLRVYYNSLVYGFEYIYNLYKNIVIPLIWEKENGDYSVGTGFKLFGGIVTAKHCITDPKHLSINGYTTDELKNSKIYCSENPDLDVAFIDVGKKHEIEVFTDEGKILQDVLTMGYPKIPAFTEFLTTEKATISGKARARLTPTRGSVAAISKNYLSKAELMLITAKIRGGNSGGPVINEEGSIVGVACQTPYYEGDIGDYDDLGYGIVVPIHYLTEIVMKKKGTIDVPPDFFRGYDKQNE